MIALGVAGVAVLSCAAKPDPARARGAGSKITETVQKSPTSEDGGEVESALESEIQRAAADLEAYLQNESGAEQFVPEGALDRSGSATGRPTSDARRDTSERLADGEPPRGDDEEVIWTSPAPKRDESRPVTPSDHVAANAARSVDATDTMDDSDREHGFEAPEPPSRSKLVVDLARRLHRDAAYSDDPLHEYLGIAALTLLDANRRIDPQALIGLGGERDREIFAAYQDFFAAVGERVRSRADLAELVEPARTLQDALAPPENLSVETFKLCRSVRSFGDYTEFERVDFLRGRTHEAIAYIEIENFSSQLATDDYYRTRLAQKIELYTDADGLLVYSVPEQVAEDRCLRRRRDFFLVRHLVLPANLSLGKYQLKVRVRDEATGAEAEAVMPIEIIAGREYR